MAKIGNLCFSLELYSDKIFFFPVTLLFPSAKHSRLFDLWVDILPNNANCRFFEMGKRTLEATQAIDAVTAQDSPVTKKSKKDKSEKSKKRKADDASTTTDDIVHNGALNEHSGSNGATELTEVIGEVDDEERKAKKERKC